MKKFAYSLALLSLFTVSLPAHSSDQKFVRWGGEDTFFRYGDWQTDMIGATTSKNSSNGLKFDSVAWQNNLLVRKKMLNDLTSHQSLVGLKKADVRKLLGNPRSFATKYPFDDQSKINTDWYLLPSMGCGSSPKNYFVLKYSKGKVIGYREVTEALLGPKYFKRLQAQDPNWHES